MTREVESVQEGVSFGIILLIALCSIFIIGSFFYFMFILPATNLNYSPGSPYIEYFDSRKNYTLIFLGVVVIAVVVNIFFLVNLKRKSKMVKIGDKYK